MHIKCGVWKTLRYLSTLLNLFAVIRPSYQLFFCGLICPPMRSHNPNEITHLLTRRLLVFLRHFAVFFPKHLINAALNKSLKNNHARYICFHLKWIVCVSFLHPTCSSVQKPFDSICYFQPGKYGYLRLVMYLNDNMSDLFPVGANWGRCEAERMVGSFRAQPWQLFIFRLNCSQTN